MIITAHQPLYMPWLGFFHKAILADTICILDDVQFADGDFINRNKIKFVQGSKWLTVPVEKKNHLNTQIRDIQIVDDGWQQRHLSLLRHAYSKSPFFVSYIGILEEIIGGVKYVCLIDLDLAILEFLFAELQIKTNIVLSSSFNQKGKKSDLILSICQQLDAEFYISGQNGVDYLNVKDFKQSQIEIGIQQYMHPTYTQAYTDFIPYLSVIDLLFNSGPNAREIIMSGNAKSWRDLATL